LRFWRSEEGVEDYHSNLWEWDGDLDVVDGQVQDSLLTFAEYPNAFERIAGVLDSRKSGHLWLTAEVGYECIVPKSGSTPDGGSHASLHRLDSQPPLLVAGKPEGVSVPDHPRIIDVAPFCCTCLQSD
jgi:hypothetical protein